MRISVLLVAAISVSPVAFAQTRSQITGSPLTQQSQTAFIRGDAGMTTFESQAAGSKETASTSAVQIGGWAGEERTVGLTATMMETSVPFSLNQSRQRTSFRDVRLHGRLWWFVPSVGVSLAEVDVDREATRTIGVIGTGMNTGLAFSVPATSFMVVTADAMAVRNVKSYDKLGGSATLPDRFDGELNTAIDVTPKMLDALVGYKIRKFKIDDGAGNVYEESSQGAYAGLRLGVYF